MVIKIEIFTVFLLASAFVTTCVAWFIVLKLNERGLKAWERPARAWQDVSEGWQKHAAEAQAVATQMIELTKFLEEKLGKAEVRIAQGETHRARADELRLWAYEYEKVGCLMSEVTETLIENYSEIPHFLVDHLNHIKAQHEIMQEKLARIEENSTEWADVEIT